MHLNKRYPKKKHHFIAKMNHLIMHLPPIHFINDQGNHFINDIVDILTTKFKIIHHKSTIY